MKILENDFIRLFLDDQARLAALTDTASGHAMPIDARGLTSPFEIDLRSDSGEILRISPQALPLIKEFEDANGRGITATWSISIAPGELVFRSKVYLADKSPISAWTCEIENLTNWALWQVSYPRVTGLTAFQVPDGPGWLAYPLGAGEKTPDPVRFVHQPAAVIPSWAREQFGAFDEEGGPADIAFSYPGLWAMQFLSYYHPGAGGIYFAAHDGHALYKRFGFYADGPGHAALVMRQFPEDRTARASDFRSFYPTMVGIHSGEWWGASELYREWALRRPWCARGPVRDRSDIPKWAKELDLWYWNIHHLYQRNHPVDIVPAIEHLQERFRTRMAFHWYAYNGENTCNSQWRDPDTFPYCPDIQKTLVNAVERLHQVGAHVIPYLNCRLWSPRSVRFQEADGMEWITADEHGKSADEWPRIGHTMCPTAPPFQQLIRKLTNQLVDEIGMDGVYLDQPTSCYAVPCFGPAHDHPPGGHDHWYRGYRALLSQVRGDLKARSPDTIMTSEGQLECFLDLFDLDLGWHVSKLESAIGSQASLPIPLFQSIYHDYHMTYGTHSCLELKPANGTVSLEQFTCAEALCLVSGTQLQVSGFFSGDECREELRPQLEYLETLLEVRKAGHDWLNFGTWRPPLQLQCDLVEVRFSDDRPPKQGIPAILNGCFELDGTVLIVLVNHTAEARFAEAELDPIKYELADRPFDLIQVWPSRKILTRQTVGVFHHDLSLPPHSARAWVLGPGPLTASDSRPE